MIAEDTALRELVDEREIERVLKNYCRAIDRGDVDLLRSVYHADALENHGTYQGTAASFIQHVAETLGLGGHQSTSHTISNIRIALDGDVARVETYVNAHHTLVHPEDGDLVHESLGARYLDRFERRDGEWRIAVRRVVFDWSRTETVTDRTYFTRKPGDGYLLGSRSAEDPSSTWD
jgi:ketosteroid isomerase-like protein